MSEHRTHTDEVRDVVEAVARAIRARDAGGAVRHYAPDSVQYSLAPPLRSSGSHAEALEEWFATWRGPIGLEHRELAVAAGGDVAFCTSLTRMTGTKTDGEEVDLWYRSTIGLRNVAGRWLIAHEHESVPFYMDGSYRAAVDLAP